MKTIILRWLGLTCFAGLYASPDKAVSIPANPADVGSVDAIIQALYKVISGSAGEKMKLGPDADPVYPRSENDGHL